MFHTYLHTNRSNFFRKFCRGWIVCVVHELLTLFWFCITRNARIHIFSLAIYFGVPLIRTNSPAMTKSIRVLRDIKARQGVLTNEVSRRAYLAIARNQTLPPQVRHQAQLQLNSFGRYTRPTTVKNRCIETGRGRGIISEFGLCRFQFRLKALRGELNGVKKASW